MKRCTKGLSILIAVLIIIMTCAAGPVPEKGKFIAITFDDGPHATITPKLLDELAVRNVKSTFFVLGVCANQYPEIVLRAHNEGHQIASHTYNHYALSTRTDDSIRNEVEDTRSLLESITGKSEFMVRPPYGDGHSNSRVLRNVNAPIILWSVDATNGRYPAYEEQLYRGTINGARDGSIILLHDTSSENLNAAMRAIDHLREQGFTFVTVEELFRLKGVTPNDNAVYKSIDDAGSYYDESLLSEHWAYTSIQDVADREIMIGDGAGFKPNEYMTRAMAVTLLWRAAGQPKPSVLNNPSFLDVPEDQWYTEAVAWGQQSGVLQGYSPEFFGPMDIANREQFSVLIVRLADHLEIHLPFNDQLPVYSDHSRISTWALYNLQLLWGAGFVSRNETSAFRPQDSITRAEAAELISWFMPYHKIPVQQQNSWLTFLGISSVFFI